MTNISVYVYVNAEMPDEHMKGAGEEAIHNFGHV
jgi:hypothetical protein